MGSSFTFSSKVQSSACGNKYLLCILNEPKEDYQDHLNDSGIVEAAAESLNPPKRLWMTAGGTALDVPGSPDKLKSLNDLPILYRTHYRWVE